MTVTLQQIDEAFFDYLECEYSVVSGREHEISSNALILTGGVKPRVFIGVPPQTEQELDRAFPSVHIRMMNLEMDFKRHEEVEYLSDDDGLEDEEPTVVYKKSDVPYCGNYAIEAWTRDPIQARELLTKLLAYFPSYGELPTETDTLDFNRAGIGVLDFSDLFKDQNTLMQSLQIELHFEVDGVLTETTPAVTAIYNMNDLDDRTLVITDDSVSVEE